MDLEDRCRAASANFIRAVGVITPREGPGSPGAEQFGEVHAFATGSAAAFFNPVMALDPGCTARHIRAAVDWIESKGLPASVQVWEDLGPRLLADMEDFGFVASTWRTPVMVMDPIPGQAPPSPAGTEIRFVGAELAEDVHTALGSGPGYRALFGPSVMADAGVRVAVAYLGGEPVSSATAIRGGGAIGVYAVGTAEHARRRGIGRATSWAVLMAGAKAWKEPVAILQSSKLGESVYRSMGFETVTRYVYFERPTSAITQTSSTGSKNPRSAGGRASRAATR